MFSWFRNLLQYTDPAHRLTITAVEDLDDVDCDLSDISQVTISRAVPVPYANLVQLALDILSALSPG